MKIDICKINNLHADFFLISGGEVADYDKVIKHKSQKILEPIS